LGDVLTLERSSEEELAAETAARPGSRGGFVSWIAGILTATAVWACWCGAPLIYDGAYQFAFTLIWQKPYVYLTRFHTWLLWYPLVWLSHRTENLTALTFAYGLPFLLAPLVGLLGSWWMVRRHAPWMMIWAAFGILAGPLPGQIFVINDSIFQQHLFWPMFMGLLAPGRRTWPQRVFLGGIVLFQFVHQIGIVLLGGLAFCLLVLLLLERSDQETSRRTLVRLAFVLGLVGLMGFKIWLTSAPHRHLPGIAYDFGQWYDSYAAEQATWYVARDMWIKGVKGFPICGMCCMYAAAALVCLRGFVTRARLASALGAAAMVCAIGGGTVWLMWASKDYRWSAALEFRRWVVPLTLPFYFFAFVEACRVASARKAGRRRADADVVDDAGPAWRLRVGVSFLLAGVFAAVIGLQSVTFASLTRHLMSDLADQRELIVPVARKPIKAWIQTTPMAHWATPCYAMVLQGKTPHKLLLEGEADPRWLFAEKPVVPLAWFVQVDPKPGPQGWYDQRPLVEAIQRAYERPDIVPTSSIEEPWDEERMLKPKPGEP
jgi:hypothetical protein